MLTPDSIAWVLGEATTFGDEWFGYETRGKREHEIALLPTGSQAVPITEPFCRVLERLKWVHAETLNYAKLADIEQGEKEMPDKFIDRLQEALRKFTDVDPKSEERGMILKIDFSFSRLQVSAISY